MLHMEILRRPFAHAGSTSIDTSRAAALDGVVAVVTGELMAQHDLAWMPTLSGDTQAVLVTDKVRFQGQEVAAVVADDRYIAAGRARAHRRRLRGAPGGHVSAAGAGGRRAAHPRRQGGPDRQPRLRVGAGDAAATDAAFAKADRVVSLETHYPRPTRRRSRVRMHRRRQLHDRSGDDLHDVAGAARAPHVVRDGRGLPEQNIRIISPDIGGGFGNKVPIYPGYVVATAASLAHRAAR